MLFKAIITFACLAFLYIFISQEYTYVHSFKPTQCLVTANSLETNNRKDSDNNTITCYQPKILVSFTRNGQPLTGRLDADKNLFCVSTVAEANKNLSGFNVNQSYQCWDGGNNGLIHYKPPFRWQGIFYQMLVILFILFLLFFRPLYFFSNFSFKRSSFVGIPQNPDAPTPVTTVAPQNRFFAVQLKGMLLFTLILGLIILFALVAVGSSYNQTTDGNVVQSHNDGNFCEFITHYSVNNKTYQLKENFQMNGSDCPPVSQDIKVFYDSTTPSRATAKTFYQRYSVVGGVLGYGVVGLLLFWWSIKVQQRKSKK
jgi:hypothetical protein